MKEKELLYYFPYAIDKQNNFRHFADDSDAFLRQFIPKYDGSNRAEFISKYTNLTPKEILEIDYRYGDYSRWSEWNRNGRHIFAFSKELLSMLEKTDAGNTTADTFHPPYDIFYLSLRPLDLKISKDDSEIIEGVYVDHQIYDASGTTYDGYCELTLDFTGNFKSVYERFAEKVSSQLPYTIDGQVKYNISPLGDFWRFWLMFDPKEGITNVRDTVDVFLKDLQREIFPLKDSGRDVTDIELDFYNSAAGLLEETINLVINCILYLSQPSHKVDLTKEYPAGLPANFDRKLSFAKSTKEKENVCKRIESSGFTKISFVGQSFRKTNSKLFGHGALEAHWRRGHWRKQKFGKDLSQNKNIWILPTIVNHVKGEPKRGQVYDVNKEVAQPINGHIAN
ncbi:MAG: hypothetical protein DI539_09895 [Flavobacterium psychrophilum]|nr:MAG: hypothetical protein DI539_09895 [Flavobacterium psychrophilum]